MITTIQLFDENSVTLRKDWWSKFMRFVIANDITDIKDHAYKNWKLNFSAYNLTLTGEEKDIFEFIMRWS